jgi:hypothetical protein
MAHFITLEKAKKLTGKYRKEKSKIQPERLPICETFDAAPFLTLLNKPGCVGLRIYFGMDDSYGVRAVIVGVNANDEDMITVPPPITSLSAPVEGTVDDDDGSHDIIEEGATCPPICPPDSPIYP